MGRGGQGRKPPQGKSKASVMRVTWTVGRGWERGDPGGLLGGEGFFSPLGLAHPERHREGQTGAEMHLWGQRDNSLGGMG